MARWRLKIENGLALETRKNETSFVLRVGGLAQSPVLVKLDSRYTFSGSPVILTNGIISAAHKNMIIQKCTRQNTAERIKILNPRNAIHKYRGPCKCIIIRQEISTARAGALRRTSSHDYRQHRLHEDDGTDIVYFCWLRLSRDSSVFFLCLFPAPGSSR